MNALLIIILVLIAILFVIPVVLLGIFCYIYVVSGYSSTYVANKINAKLSGNYVHIKSRKIGNRFFSIDTIEKITILGVAPYGHLYDQTVDLQETVNDIVSKITSFQLEKQYPNQDATQSQVNAFCNNFRELGRMLAHSDIIDGEAINDIISKIWHDNRTILAELHSYNNFLDKYIEINRQLLFNTHSSEGEKILSPHTESPADDTSAAE